ncbi:MAG: NTP transferase domain-containing protein, partial [Thermoprotei archaeon]|nr:NTP transferase domain-containing protein [Thermoprotei archaeon]
MHIETAIILAAGKGTRLIPLTISRPKVLLPVGGVPLLKRQIDMLISLGVQKIVLVVNYRAKSIESFVGDVYADSKVEFSFINQGKPLGTAHAVEVTEDHVRPPFIVLYGDIYTTYDVLTNLVNALNHADASIIAIRVPDPWNYGVFKVDSENRILDVIEKPPPGKEPSNLINGGIYAFRDLVIFDYIKKTGISPRGEKEFTDS